MNPTHERGHAENLAGHDPLKALNLARRVSDPWYRAQALSYVAWRTPEKCVEIAQEAATSAANASTLFERTAVRVWEIEALARCGYESEAINSLEESVESAVQIEPPSARSECLFRLLEASFRFGDSVFQPVYGRLVSSCDPTDHWRCAVNIKRAKQLQAGDYIPTNQLVFNEERHKRILTESYLNWLLLKAESGRGDGIAPVTPPTPPGMRDCLAIARPTGSLSAGCLPAVGCTGRFR
jgi:hypothetical protein